MGLIPFNVVIVLVIIFVVPTTIPMAMLGADSIKDKISFSMNDSPDQLYWSIRENLENKIGAAQVLISDKDTKKRYVRASLRDLVKQPYFK